MAERAFNAYPHEVRAIQTGLQTQFRRVVKPQPFVPDGAVIRLYDETATHMTGRRCWQVERPGEYDGRHVIGNRDDSGRQTNIGRMQFCVGDKLWVRETWREWGELSLHYAADGLVVPMLSDRKLAHYLAHRSPFTWHSYKWRPSIHMPRWASRITLEVTGVRVERLQDISRGDAMAEGCPFPNMAKGPDPRQWYADLWNAINGPGSWDANPWVWCVSFKRVEVSNA